MPDYYGTGIYGTAVFDTIPTPPTPPSNTVAPAVTGTVLVGSSIVCSNGTWTDAGHISYSYQWQTSPNGTTGWTDLVGSTNSEYVISSIDVPHFLRCVVMDTDANGSTSANSNVVGAAGWPLPINMVLPVVSGTPQVGDIVVAGSGTWNDDGSPIFSYQWQVSPDGTTGWSNFSAGAVYLIESSRLGQYLRCTVTNTDSGGAASAISNTIGPVKPPAGLLLTPIGGVTLTLAPDPNSP